MAFTLTPMLSVLLLLVSNLYCVLAQFPGPANSLGGSYDPLGTGNGFGGGGDGGYPGGSLSGGVPGLSGYHPGGQGSPPRPRRPKATMRAHTGAGDSLYLTIEEDDDYSQGGPLSRGNLFGRLQFSFPGNPFLRGGQSRELRVHGTFIKAGSDSGIASQDSLRGTFAMVVMTNGNTAAACSGTGPPYRTGGSRGGPLGRGGPFGGNPYSNLFGGGNPFRRNPFFGQRGYGQQQSELVVVSTPLKATHSTATIEGKLRNVSLKEILGRSIQVCLDPRCIRRTDMCGIIGFDTMSIDEFAKYKQQHAALLNLHAQGGKALPSTNPLGSTYPVEDNPAGDLFGNAGGAAPSSGLAF